MIPLPGLALRLPEFTAVAAFDGKAMQAELTGVAEMTAARELSTLLKDLHAAALRYKTKSVVVDLLQLEFMNSSCLKSFITWLKSLQELPEATRYVVQFLTDPARSWQKKSMQAVSCFAPQHVQVK